VRQPVEAAQLDRGQALAARRNSRLQPLSRLELGQLCAPNRLHVNEHVLAAQLFRPLDETIAANAVEPFDLHRLELAGRFGQRLAVSPLRRRNGRPRGLGQGRAQVDREDALRLEPALEPNGDAFDQRAFGYASPPVLAKHAEMKQHVAVDLVADEETEPARRVEPFHPPRDRRKLRLGGIILGYHGGPYPSLGQTHGRTYHPRSLTWARLSANRLLPGLTFG